MSASYAQEPEHIADVSCWCHPTVKNCPDGQVVIHRSLVECIFTFGERVMTGPEHILKVLAHYDFLTTQVPRDKIVIIGSEP
jgi:hypothetical protein